MRHAFFSLAPPRHPLARAGLALVGLAILGLLSMLGLAVAAVVVGVVAVRATWRRLAAPVTAPKHAGPQVIDGEFRVISHRDHLVSR